MKKTIGALVIMLLFLATGAMAKDCKAIYGSSDQPLRIATGSPGELGLLEVLADAFNARHQTSICWKKAGSGASLNLLKKGEVDLVMVHAPGAEKKAMSEGWAENRTLLGSNEFYIVGPKSDPANIAQAEDVAQAYTRIANAEAPFLSRGDNSGTHKKEMSIWDMAGISPSGNWYMITNDFMMATLRKANEVNGYFMTDSSTWVAGKKGLDNLAVLFTGDPYLVNVYHALSVPEGAENAGLARAFIDFAAGEMGQEIMGSYGLQQFGQPMYNDADYAGQYDH